MSNDNIEDPNRDDGESPLANIPSVDLWSKGLIALYKQRAFAEDSARIAWNALFWPMSAVADLLVRRGFVEAKEKYLDYGKWRDFYPELGTQFRIQYGRELRTLDLPYQCLIDVSAEETPSLPRMLVEPSISRFSLDPELELDRREAFEAFCIDKPNVTDGPIAGIAKLGHLDGGDLVVALHRAGYFDQIKTNLTLDYVSQGSGRALRARDQKRATRGALPSFSESALVNSIGASAVVLRHVDGRPMIFAHIRKLDLGTFAGHLGTVSGVVNYFDGQPCHELATHAGWSMVREFERETGLNAEEVGLRVAPLAFCRELVRGGKPQFFFLIEVTNRDLDKAHFNDAFEKSAEGLKEFFSGICAGKSFKARLSPEFAMNFLLAAKHLAARNGSGPNCELLRLPAD